MPPVVAERSEGMVLPDDLGISQVSMSAQKINALIYAFPGVGKTTFANTANDHPDLAPALFLNLEGGLLSVAHSRPNKIDVQSVDHLEQILHLYAQGDSRLTRFRTLILDSATELQSTSLQSHIAGRQRGNRNRDLNDINRDDYGRMTVQLQRVLRMLRDLPVHTVVTALPTVVYPDGERGGEPSSVFPAFTPRLATAVMGFFDFVWYMYAVPDEQEGTETRYILTRDRGAYKAKTRGPAFRDALGERYPDPTLPALYELLVQTEGGVGSSEQDTAFGLESLAAPSRPAVSPNGVPVVNLPSVQDAEGVWHPAPDAVVDMAEEAIDVDAGASPEAPEEPPAIQSQSAAPAAPVVTGRPRVTVRTPARMGPAQQAMANARQAATARPGTPNNG